MLDSAKKQLIDIGLNDYEAGVYLTLVERSPASAAFIAKSLKLSRSTVYTALERLIAKGLVGTSYKNEVKQFIAEPPSAIEDVLHREKKSLEEKFTVFKNLSEHLNMLSRADAAVPNIIFFEGKESLKKIYLGMLRAAEKHAVMYVIRDEFKWEKEWSFVLGEEWKSRVRRLRAENDIVTKMLINDSKEERKHVDYYLTRKHLEFRFLPKEHSVEKFVTYVLGDTVSVLSMEKNNLVGIKITNRHIAKNFEKLFGAMWKQAKKP